MTKKSKEGLSVKKEENFSEWFSQILEKAELIDLRLNMKGFMVFRPLAAMTIENMFKLFEEELQKKSHKPTLMPLVIPEANLKQESSHVKGFTPEVFWLKEIGKEKLALRPTSETLYTPMFKLWVRSYRDLPLKLYQRGSVFRLDTKATRPLIRTREIIWIEAHDAFATKAEAEAQVQEDINTTEKIMHQKLGIPFLAIKRPQWDKFPGAEYTVGSDVFMPDGKLIQQPSTHLMGQKFSKAFEAKFKNIKGKEEYLWTTAYGPAMSRILASIISTHGDNQGLIFPFCIAPTQTIIIPIYNAQNKNKIIKESNKLKEELNSIGIRTEIDASEKRPGEKYHYWELRGVPFRIEIGEKELKTKKVTLSTRNIKEKETLSIKKISKLKELGIKFDTQLKEKAEKFMKERVINSKTKKEMINVIKDKKVARVNFCSTDKQGEKCAEIIEKEINAEVRGTLANKKEKATGKCIICGKPAKEVVYVGKSY
ncbi:proline--tRNA ligase [Candidatus Pacearchaeota archaeon]|nr:proline--tRNA ligase [Candidatus Pacearchaeota archaeon]